MKRLLVAIAALVICGAAAAAVNLNTATKEELVALPGIGPSKAQAILDYRNQHGPFRSVDELRKVKGIGEKLFNQIRPELALGAQKPASALPAPKPEAKVDKSAPRATAGPIAKEAVAKK